MNYMCNTAETPHMVNGSSTGQLVEHRQDNSQSLKSIEYICNSGKGNSRGQDVCNFENIIILNTKKTNILPNIFQLMLDFINCHENYH